VETDGNEGDLVRACKDSRGSSGGEWTTGPQGQYDDPGKEQPTYKH